MSDTLAEICAVRRTQITKNKAHISEAQLIEKIKSQAPVRGFIRAIRHKLAEENVALIAEIKKASPSKGIIREDFDPATLAKNYEQGGAACLSILTEEHYFMGADVYLQHARSACELPCLRKDFMLEPYQIYESRALGADCILLIMAALSDVQAQELEQLAHALGMDVLVEVHDREEMERALTHLTSPLLGVNNRNLKTLKVDLATSEILAADIPKEKIAVCESGIVNAADIGRMRVAGFHTFLVGETLMREKDVTRATKLLLGGTHG